jgi:N-acetylneuraminic acid mutarotase
MKMFRWAPLFLLCFLSCSNDKEFGYPLIQTGEVTDIDNTGATFHARIIDLSKEDISEYGFVWGMEEMPDINSSQVKLSAGPESGTFSVRITNDLISSKVYFVRAFARNKIYITYGKQVSFKSKGSLPPVIYDFFPKEGSGGTQVIITGNYFSGSVHASKVTFGNAEVRIDSAQIDKMVVTLPADIAVSGVVNISVSTAYHTVISDSTFHLLGCTIYDIDPRKIIGGDKILVFAKDYDNNLAGNVLKIGGLECDILKIEHDTITAYVPYNARVGYNDISLAANGKTCYSNEMVNIKYPWDKVVNNMTFIREGLVGFSIGNFGFCGLGLDGVYLSDCYQDLQKWSLLQNSWTKCNDFPGGPRRDAAGFSIGEKGYVGLGQYNYTKQVFYKTLYAYDPNSDEWTKKADFPGDERMSVFCLEIGEKAYIGMGGNFGTDYKDFWEYDPKTDIWTRKADFPSPEGYGVIGFAIRGKGYIGFGFNDPTFNSKRDFWEYNAQSDTWKRLADFPGTPRGWAKGFSLGTKGYVGMGFSGYETSGASSDFWLYDSENDKWSRIADVPYAGRFGYTNFIINGKAYICGGVPTIYQTYTQDESLIVFDPN